ncbi:MAG: DNA mismatch repair endonuclease MutL [Candidatus Obscuribacterales bacterium]|nr:DNA mismatch repair endonuclease MutL [Candidatus Obscuribacterales bacterium]
MPKVFVLPDHIASQIAAGEVVERPASVVKELVENSIDAGATAIEISVSADCRDLTIADNGSGMDPEDAILAFQRHATSKLKSAEDLFNLNTLGFRGEALPSIASISKFTCYTRTQEAPHGSKVESAEGKITAQEAGCAPGTIMEIRELFYNTPARLKFMKKAATEFGHIHETVQSLAISYPHVAFNLLRDSDTVMRTTGSGNLQEAVIQSGFLTGKETLVPVEHASEIISTGSQTKGSLKLVGLIARPLHFRGDRKGILTIVNGRTVRCPLTLKALDYVYSDLIPRGRYPLAVLKLELDPSVIDVNIHPTKKELKYQSGNEIYINIQRALSRTLRENSMQEAAAYHAARRDMVVEESFTPSQDLPEREIARIVEDRPTPPRRDTALRVSQIDFKDRLAFAPQEREEVSLDVVATRFEPTRFEPAHKENSIESAQLISAEDPDTLPQAGDLYQPFDHNQRTHDLPLGWRLCGYLHNTYIFFETPEGLEIVEQHIAHERTLYERLLAMQQTPGRLNEFTQELFTSIPLKLSLEQAEILKQSQEALAGLGFAFAQNQATKDWEVSRLPLQLAGVNYRPVIQKMLDDLLEVDAAHFDLEATKSIACQSAIKNGMPLSQASIFKLVSEWLDTERNDTCPHGRPVRLKFSKEKLFEMFHPV